MVMLGCRRLVQAGAARGSRSIHRDTLLTAGCCSGHLPSHSYTLHHSTWTGIVLFCWIITLRIEDSCPVGLNPRILTCRSTAEDGNLCCRSTLFLPSNCAHDSVKWGAEKTEHKWFPEEKLGTDCAPICLEPGTLALRSCGQ